MLGPEIKAESDTKLVKSAEQTIEEKNRQLALAKKIGKLKELALIDLAKTIAKATGENAEKNKLDAIARNNHDRTTISHTTPKMPTQKQSEKSEICTASVQQNFGTYTRPRHPRI